MCNNDLLLRHRKSDRETPGKPNKAPPPGDAVTDLSSSRVEDKDFASGEPSKTSKPANGELIRPNVEPPTLDEMVKWRYIGVLTKKEAETFVNYSTEFRLYHQWNPLVR
ncbi:unnamed protein product [Gongylonema pulchrum]|uniref:SANT domain-containing protein n=1 Tax=Gongylonema pulchrum TaxID=637853 RepID=A0A183CYU2_9BILA|nr:unnamed protein product [Gongylonema pulchrum]